MTGDDRLAECLERQANAFLGDAAQVKPAGNTASTLAEARPYICRFHGKLIVVKYRGYAMTDESLTRSFTHDVTLLKLFGLSPIVVHGGCPQIDRLLSRAGKKGKFIKGMRLTAADTMVN